MENASTARRVALLIDADNLSLSNKEKVLRISGYYGHLEVRHAYGDWQQPPLAAQKQALQALQIEPIQVNRNGKNATDNRLLMDVGALLERGDIYTFIISSGDGDFTVACQHIREQGKQIIGIGGKKQTSKDLHKSCDRFYFLDDLDEELHKLANPLHHSPEKKSEMFAELSLAYHQLAGQSQAWVSHADMRQQLQNLSSDYQNRYVGNKLAHLLQVFDYDFESHDERVRRVNANPLETLLQLIIESHPHHTCLKLILDAYTEEAQGYNWISLSTLGSILNQNSEYKRRFSSKKLSAWLKIFDKTFEVKNGMVCRISSEPIQLNYILSAYAEITQSGREVSLSILGMTLRKNLALDYERYFGGKKLSSWIKLYPQCFKIEGTQVHLLDCIRKGVWR